MIETLQTPKYFAKPHLSHPPPDPEAKNYSKVRMYFHKVCKNIKRGDISNIYIKNLIYVL